MNTPVATASEEIGRLSKKDDVDSTDDLIEAAMGRRFPRWSAGVRAAMLAEASAGDQVVAYVRANHELAADGSHAWHHALSRATLSASARRRMVSMHETLTERSSSLSGKRALIGSPDPSDKERNA